MKKFYLIFILVLGLTTLSFGQKLHVVYGNGTPASPDPIEYVLPDNTNCEVYLRGDMVFNWFETIDGYLLLRDSEGYLEYAMLDNNGDAISSGLRHYSYTNRSSQELDYINSLSEKIFYSQKQIDEISTANRLHNGDRASLMGGFPSIGTNKMLMILARFSDTTPTYSQSQFDNLMNQPNYNGTGSFKDFYYENSYGKLTINTTVTQWVTVPNTRQYYASRAAEFVRDAVNAAHAAGINFAQFDNDGDGYVDGVAVIHTGQGQEVSGNTLDIWSHNWSLTSAGYNVVKDGVRISAYTCQPEKYTSTSITGIGVICHEVGHNLGIPDFYDTDYATGGQYSGTGRWDVMCGGSYNNNGRTPCHHNPWSKAVLGWVTPKLLSNPEDVVLINTTANPEVYRINTVTTNEYYLLENRQRIGFDSYLPASGLIIYHRHKDMGSYVNSNKINTTHPQRFFPVVSSITSDPKTSGNYGNINSTACPFPGSTNKTSFTDSTVPNMKTWTGQNNDSPITEIAHNTSTRTITFKFKGGGIGSIEANFTSNKTIVETGESVTFTDQSTTSAGTSITSRNWTFTGGTPSTSTAQNPTVVYNTAGTYAVSLTVSNGVNTDTKSVNSYITVLAPGQYCPAGADTITTTDEYISNVSFGSISNNSSSSGYADYTHLSTNVTAGQTYPISVTNAVSFSLDQLLIWIDFNQNGVFDANELVFTGNEPGTSSQTAYTYSGNITIPANAASGTTRMRIRLHYNSTQYNGNGTPCGNSGYGEVEDYSINVVTGTQAPNTNFSASTTNIDAGGNIAFTDLSTNNPTSWSWTFTGGSPSSSTVQNPTVTYNTAGVYAVSLTATNAGGSNTETKTAYITVNTVIPAPVADFTANTTSILPTGFVEFTDLSTNNPSSWYWEFPGGIPSTSIIQHPIVAYNTPGSFEVKLTVTNSTGSNTITKSSFITVADNTTNISSNSESLFSLYPNPTSNKVWLEFNNNPTQIDLSIIDITGKSIEINYIYTNNIVEIDLQKLESGIYFIKVCKNNISEMHKIIKN